MDEQQQQVHLLAVWSDMFWIGHHGGTGESSCRIGHVCASQGSREPVQDSLPKELGQGRETLGGDDVLVCHVLDYGEEEKKIRSFDDRNPVLFFFPNDGC